MANNHLISSIYRIGAYDLSNSTGAPATQGVPHSFPSAGTIFRPAPAGTVACGVTMNSIIEVLPTGLNQNSKTYYSADSVATLNTASI